jgi:hypothetical protein
MTDRRRTPRYVLGTPLSADVMPMHDVTVELFSATRVIVVSSAAHGIGEELTIHVAGMDGPVSHPARVVSCSPVSAAGTLSFRLELEVEEDESSGMPEER